MKNNKRRKTVTLLLAAIAGECAALLIIIVILVYTAPAGLSQKNISASSVQATEEASSVNAKTAGSQPRDIDAVIQLVNTKLLVKEYIEIKPLPGSQPVSEAVEICLPSANKAVTSVKNVMFNGSNAVYRRKGSDITVVQPEKSGILFIEYEVLLGTKPEILSFSKDKVLLTDFLAVPAVYRNSSPLPIYVSTLGDPYRYDIYNYKVQVQADKSFKAYAPGKKSEAVLNGTRITSFEADRLRDFPLVLYKKADIVTIRQGNTDIILINAGSSANYAEYAFNYARNLIGPYPYKELFVVAADFPLRGMEFSNMVFISEACFKDSSILKRVLAHEVFHQWFYGIIGTDQLNEPFMDEGMVTFLTSRLYGDWLPSGYDPRFMSMNLTRYVSKTDYNQLAYIDASAYFGQLWRKMGNNFNGMLKKIYNDMKFKTLYFDDFKKYLTQFSGGN